MHPSSIWALYFLFSKKSIPIFGGYKKSPQGGEGTFRFLAPAVGLEPTTDRLTADCSTTELRWNSDHLFTSKKTKLQAFFLFFLVNVFFWRSVPESNQHKRICSPLHKPFCQPTFLKQKYFYTFFFK